MKTITAFMFLMFYCLCITGCKNSSKNNTSIDEQIDYLDNDSFFEVTNKEDKKAFFDYCIDYELNIPDSEISYKVLWKGYDTNNKFGPSISLKDRFYTYLVEYGNNKNVFFWITVGKDKLIEFNDWYKLYKKEHLNDLRNFHFVDDINVFDGKYLLYAQSKQIDNYKVYRSSNPLDVSLIKDNEQLAICLQAKTVTILKNVSSNIAINKKIIALNRFAVRFNEESNKFEQYYFEIPELYNVNVATNIFSFYGKRLECYPNSFENMNYCYCPLMGLYGSGLSKTKRADLIDDKTIALPRYVKSYDGNGFVDLLDINEDLFYTEDVYGDLKSIFLEAFLYDDSLFDGQYIYSLFDYEKIVKIIERAGAFND